MLLLPALVALGFAATPQAARAGCGHVQRMLTHHRSRLYRPPLAIGDSTMLLAMQDLAAEGYDVNAHGCRQFAEALALLEGLRRGRAVPHMVVIALGADGSVTARDVDRALAIIGRQRILVLVTPRELGGGAGSDAQAVRNAGRRHPDRIRVLDWVGYSSGHGGWFQPDHLHLTFSGAGAFAGLFVRALPLAVPAPPQPVARPCPAPPNGPAEQPPGPLLVVPGAILHVGAAAGAVSVPMKNTGSLPLAGRARMSFLSPGRPPRVGQLIASACLSVRAGATSTLVFALSPPARARIRRQWHFPIQISLSVSDPAGRRVDLAASYLLQRPRRR